MMLLHTLAIVSTLLSLARGKVLHTSSRWVLDDSNQRYKMRCVNWAGHGETNIPEGLQHRSVDDIAALVASTGFNCVRLTYSIDMALGPNVHVAESFVQAAANSGIDVNTTTALYGLAVQRNPFLADARRIDVFTRVIEALGRHGVDVVLDNHVSRAQWCCNLDDGNGWWDEATGYNALSSRYFNTSNWLLGLTAMASYSKRFNNVIGMSLRNELRSLPPQNLDFYRSWTTFVTKGANAVHATNPDLLIMVGGTEGALNLSFLRIFRNLFDRTPYNNKIVWEYHVYSYSPGYYTGDCNAFKSQMGAAAGYLLQQGKSYTGPLWLSEFGFGMVGGPDSQNGLNDQDHKYFACLSDWLSGNDAEWAYWPLQGDYYIREGAASVDESYGVLNRDWTGFRNPKFLSLFGNGMWNVTQGPGLMNEL